MSVFQRDAYRFHCNTLISVFSRSRSCSLLRTVHTLYSYMLDRIMIYFFFTKLGTTNNSLHFYQGILFFLTSSSCYIPLKYTCVSCDFLCCALQLSVSLMYVYNVCYVAYFTLFNNPCSLGPCISNVLLSVEILYTTDYYSVSRILWGKKCSWNSEDKDIIKQIQITCKRNSTDCRWRLCIRLLWPWPLTFWTQNLISSQIIPATKIGRISIRWFLRYCIHKILGGTDSQTHSRTRTHPKTECIWHRRFSVTEAQNILQIVAYDVDRLMCCNIWCTLWMLFARQSVTSVIILHW